MLQLSAGHHVKTEESAYHLTRVPVTKHILENTARLVCMLNQKRIDKKVDVSMINWSIIFLFNCPPKIATISRGKAGVTSCCQGGQLTCYRLNNQ